MSPVYNKNKLYLDSSKCAVSGRGSCQDSVRDHRLSLCKDLAFFYLYVHSDEDIFQMRDQLTLKSSSNIASKVVNPAVTSDQRMDEIQIFVIFYPDIYRLYQKLQNTDHKFYIVGKVENNT